MAQERTDNRRITFQIEAHLGVLSKGKDGWNKELNLVSWNGAAIPKFDIRDWSEDHRKMGRGITLFGNEMGKACHMYLDYCNAKIVAESRDSRSAAAEAGIRAGEEERARLEQEKAEREQAELEHEPGAGQSQTVDGQGSAGAEAAGAVDSQRSSDAEAASAVGGQRSSDAEAASAVGGQGRSEPDTEPAAGTDEEPF